MTPADVRTLDALHRDLRRRYWHLDNDGIPLPQPPTPHRPRRDWRTRLDARISRCTGCDSWCWDGLCFTCDEVVDNRVHKCAIPGPTWDNVRTDKAGPGGGCDDLRDPRHKAREGASMTCHEVYPSGGTA